MVVLGLEMLCWSPHSLTRPRGTETMSSIAGLSEDTTSLSADDSLFRSLSSLGGQRYQLKTAAGPFLMTPMGSTGGQVFARKSRDS